MIVLTLGENAEIFGVVTLLTVAQLRRLNFPNQLFPRASWTYLSAICYLSIHLRAIKKTSGTTLRTNNTSTAMAIIWRPVKPMMRQAANGYLLQSRFPMITKFSSLNRHFGWTICTLFQHRESGACLAPIFRFQALAASSTNILLEQELGETSTTHLKPLVSLNVSFWRYG